MMGGVPKYTIYLTSKFPTQKQQTTLYPGQCSGEEVGGERRGW